MRKKAGKYTEPNKYGRVRKRCVVTHRATYKDPSKYKPHQGHQECARRREHA